MTGEQESFSLMSKLRSEITVLYRHRARSKIPFPTDRAEEYKNRIKNSVSGENAHRRSLEPA